MVQVTMGMQSDIFLENTYGGVDFFSPAEWHTCYQIVQILRQEKKDILLAMPAYAQDVFFCNRLKAMMQSSMNDVIICDQIFLNLIDFMYFTLKQTPQGMIFLENYTDIPQAFFYYLLDSFEKKRKIIFLIMSADCLTLEMIKGLLHLKNMIYEKYPEHQKQTLCRFVWMGYENIYHLLKDFDKTNMRKEFPVIVKPVLITGKDIEVFVHFYHKNTQDPHVFSPQACALIAASVAGSFVRFRMVMPLQTPMVKTEDDQNFIADYHQQAGFLLKDDDKSHFLYDSQIYTQMLQENTEVSDGIWQKIKQFFPHLKDKDHSLSRMPRHEDTLV